MGIIQVVFSFHNMTLAEHSLTNYMYSHYFQGTKFNILIGQMLDTTIKRDPILPLPYGRLHSLHSTISRKGT